MWALTRFFSSIDGPFQIFQFLLHQKSCHGRFQKLGDPFRGSVGPMSGAKGVVHVQIKRLGELFHKLRIVLLFFLVESRIFQQNDITGTGARHELGHLVADAIRGQRDGLAEQFSHPDRARTQAVLVVKAILGTSTVTAHRDNGTLVDQVLDRGNAGTDPRVVRNGLAIQRNVQIAPNQHSLALQFGFSQGSDALFR